MFILVQFWRGNVVETLDKWEKEWEIDIRVMLTGISAQPKSQRVEIFSVYFVELRLTVSEGGDGT